VSAADLLGYDSDGVAGDEDTDETPRPERVSVGAVLLSLLVLIVAIYLEVALAIDARLLGAVPALALIVIVAIALRLGPLWGAAVGFASGLLVLTPIGWAVGAWAERRRRVTLGLALLALLGAVTVAVVSDVVVTIVIEQQGVAWGSVGVRALAEIASTLLIGIVTLAVLRRVLRQPSEEQA
jgi:hypothetical protein